MKIKLKCRNCGWETIQEINSSPIGSLVPSNKIKGSGIKVKWSKEAIDKIMKATEGLGASREELSQLGIDISVPEWKEAEERQKLRRFIKRNLRVSREKRQGQGERSQVSTAPWQMGDSFRDVDLASSEVKAMGIKDLRLIPGVTMQKRVYETTKGQEREVLRGIKFFNIIDVSGSMISMHSTRVGQIDKIHKALMMSEEIYRICKKLGYAYNLAIFSGSASRIPKKRTKAFFKDPYERKKYNEWSGGTVLSSALNIFSLKELKDGNLVIMSDMDIADFKASKERLKEIGNVTNSFKVVVIEYVKELKASRIERIRKLFPTKKVEILEIKVN